MFFQEGADVSLSETYLGFGTAHDDGNTGTRSRLLLRELQGVSNTLLKYKQGNN